VPSIVTSIIGGIQGSSAAHNAANSLTSAYNTAGQTVVNAANAVNPTITSAAGTAANNVIAAGTTAGTNAVGTAATGTAALSPYTTAGSTAANNLSAALQPGGALDTPFTAQTMASMSPGYQFEQAQGDAGVQRAAAAAGLTGSGGTMKALSAYNQNLASTAYQNAFQDYTTQNQNLFNNLNSQAQQGQTAATTAAGMNTQASEYAGTTGVGTTEVGNNLNVQAANTTAQNTLSANNYLANTQVGAGQATAQGDIGAANAWNGMLGSLGTAGNNLVTGGTGMFTNPFAASSSVGNGGMSNISTGYGIDPFAGYVAGMNNGLGG
jgi:hypothetical protein